MALRRGLATSVAVVRVVTDERASKFCDRCASPIDFGAVMNGAGTYCSVECSLGGSSA